LIYENWVEELSKSVKALKYEICVLYTTFGYPLLVPVMNVVVEPVKTSSRLVECIGNGNGEIFIDSKGHVLLGICIDVHRFEGDNPCDDKLSSTIVWRCCTLAADTFSPSHLSSRLL
jgi:hypothetical protein